MDKSQQDMMLKMTDQELLNAYFENGGSMTAVGYQIPAPTNPNDSICFFAIDCLMSRKTGNELLLELLRKFSAGQIDEFGKIKK